LIIAGTDTVAITLHWTFALLCHYPDMQTRISDEIDQFIEKHGRSPEFEDRDEFPFSISVMKESMRFKPITPFGLPHAANRDGKSCK
jgi:cytochrome P450